jgi:integrase
MPRARTGTLVPRALMASGARASRKSTRTARRRARSTRSERTLEMYALEAIGRLPLCDVRPSHVRGILDDAAAKGLRRATVCEIRGALHRLFRDAREAEPVEHNPVTPVRTPKARETRKERAILTDEEFARFVACPEVGLETRMLSLVRDAVLSE